jgi:hypothetical protein|tara:strand:+ start:544 stop:720 length:177 start_codon:yes stop_codon:yes gene_type:complete
MPKYRVVATLDVGYEAIIDAPDQDTAWEQARDDSESIKWKKIDDGHDWTLESIEEEEG